MLKIRMQRTGRINMPSFRIVVTEHTASPKAGKFIEKLGTYDPKSKQRTLATERVKYWMSVGAKPSDTVHNMLVSLGVISGKKINVLPAYKAPAAADLSAEGRSASGGKEEAATPEAAPEAAKEEVPTAEAPASSSSA